MDATQQAKHPVTALAGPYGHPFHPILVTAPIGALEHDRLGNVARPLLPGLALGALLGAPLASWAVQGLPQATLTRGFALFLIANGVRMLWAGRRRKQASGPSPGR